MSSQSQTYTIQVNQEDGGYWAEVVELPGCFATGDDLDELYEALSEAIGMYLSDDKHHVEARFEGNTQQKVELCSA